MTLHDADLIGIHGRTIVAIWPGGRAAVRRIALEATADGRFVVVADECALASHQTMAAGLNAVRALDAFGPNPSPSLMIPRRRRPSRDHTDAHGVTVLAAEPPQKNYPIRRLALERSGDSLLLVANGQVLDTFDAGDRDAALAAFWDLHPGAPLDAEDLGL